MHYSIHIGAYLCTNPGQGVSTQFGFSNQCQFELRNRVCITDKISPFVKSTISLAKS